MRILIVEDNADLAAALSRIFEADGHVVDVAEDGEAADSVLAAESIDFVILDLGLPHMSGLDVLRRLRARQAEAMVLILTARGSLEDRVKGLDLGADDYMTKPFEIAELEARVRTLMRRRAGATGSVVELGDLAFDVAVRRATIAREPLDLPKRELDLLEALVLRCDRFTPKTELCEAISSFDDAISDGALEVYISRLRKRLETAGVRIRVLRGLGYMLEAQ